MSRWAALAALVVATAVHAAEPVRVLVSIGNNLGDPSDAPLSWAEADAQRVASLFVDFGDVAPQRAKVLLGATAEQVREALAEARGRVDELAAEGHDVVLLVYVSAHAQAGVLHLGGTHLPLDDVRKFLETARARLRVGFVDACDSGVLARRKGGAQAPAFEVGLAAGQVRGLALITSSGPAEASQEWASLKGSLFTHHLLTGLRGDADADDDGQVSLAEVYAYAFRRTVQSAARSGQHPAFDLDMSGTGELALAAPRKGRSAVVLPASAQGHFIVSSQPRPDIVAEVHKEAGRPLRLAVPPGRYLVQKRLGLKVGLATVEIPFGGERTLDEQTLELRGFGEVALKGGFLEVRPWAAFVFGAVGLEHLQGSGAEWRAGVGLRRGFDAWWGGVSLAGSYRSFRATSMDVSELSAALRVEGGYRVLEWPVVPLFGVLLEPRVLHQSVVRDEETVLQDVTGQGPVPPRTTFGLSGGAVVGLEVPLGERLFVQGRGVVSARWLPAENQAPVTFGLEGSLLVGVRF